MILEGVISSVIIYERASAGKHATNKLLLQLLLKSHFPTIEGDSSLQEKANNKNREKKIFSFIVIFSLIEHEQWTQMVA